MLDEELVRCPDDHARTHLRSSVACALAATPQSCNSKLRAGLRIVAWCYYDVQDRVVIRTGREGKDSGNAVNPWNCLAQRAMLGGYSNLEQQTDVSHRLGCDVVV